MPTFLSPRGKNCPATGFSSASGVRATHGSVAGSFTVIVAVRTVGVPPLSTATRTVSVPLFCARLSTSLPSATSLMTAMSETVHVVFSLPAPAACIAVRLSTCGATSTGVRPSQVAGALSVNTGSGMVSLIVTAMSCVFTPVG